MPPKHRHRSRSPAAHPSSSSAAAASTASASGTGSVKSLNKSPTLSSSSSAGRHAPQLAPLEVKGQGVVSSYAAVVAASESMPGDTLLDRTPSEDPSLAAVQAMPDDGVHQAAKLPDPHRDPSLYASIKIAAGLPGIGRALAWKVATSANIPNRLVSLFNLVNAPSLTQREWQTLPGTHIFTRKPASLVKAQAALNKVFDAHIAPFLIVNRDFPDVTKRIGYVRDQFHVAFYSWMSASDEAHAKVAASLKAQMEAKAKHRATLSATTKWRLWGPQLLALFECMPSTGVARMMGVCKNWKLQAERNRIWRRLSIRNYPWQDDEDTPASHGYRYWYHRYLVLMNSDRVAVRIKFGNNDQAGLPAGAPRPYLFDRGDVWAAPARNFEWLKYGWENSVTDLARDRRQPWGHTSYGATQTAGKAGESFDRATLIHFHPWQAQTDKWRQTMERTSNYNRLQGGSIDEEPRNWVAELPAGEYRISIAGGDVMMTSQLQLYANGRKMFTDAQAASQIGIRVGVADVVVGPDRLLHVSCVPNLVPTSTWRCWCCSKINLPQSKWNGTSGVLDNYYCQQCGVMARSTDANSSVRRHVLFENAPPRDTPGDSYYPSTHDHRWQPGRRLIGIQSAPYNRDGSGRWNTGNIAASVKGFSLWYASPVDPTHVPHKINLNEYFSNSDQKAPDHSYSIRPGDPIIGVAVEYDDRKAGIMLQATFTTLSGQKIQTAAYQQWSSGGGRPKPPAVATWVAPAGHCMVGMFGISASDMGLPEYRRAGWHKFGVYYMPIATYEAQINRAEMKDVKQGSVAVAPPGTSFGTKVKTELPRIVSMTIIDKKLLNKQAPSVVRQLTGYGFMSPEKARPWQPRAVESLPPSPEDEQDANNTATATATSSDDTKRVTGTGPATTKFAFPPMTTFDNWGEVKVEKDGKTSDGKTAAASGSSSLSSSTSSGVVEWNDATCVGFEARIRELKRAQYIAEMKWNEAKKAYDPLNEQLTRLEALARTEDQVAITRRGMRRQVLQREHDSSMAITTARLKYIQTELSSRKVDVAIIPPTAVNGAKKEDPKSAAKAAAKTPAKAPVKMLLTPTPETKTGPVDDGKHEFVLAPDPIAQAELKGLDTHQLRSQEAQIIKQLIQMNHEFAASSERFEKEGLPVGEVGQEVAALRPRVVEANARVAATATELAYTRSRIDAMPRMRLVPSTTTAVPSTATSIEIVDFEWDKSCVITSK